MSRLVFVHRIDSNVGDRLSGPYLHWDWEPHEVLDICDLRGIDALEPGARVIIGGGGLLLPYFMPFLERLQRRQPSKVVWWGVGERMVQDLERGYLPESRCGGGITPGTFPDGHLVGVRVVGSPYRHVPCCSCRFIERFLASCPDPPTNDVVMFEHEAVALPAGAGFPKMVNTECTPPEAIRFIASGRVVVTNSYHGMYWARLLGRPVVCVPFSSAHYRNDWGVLYSDPSSSAGTVATALRTLRVQGGAAGSPLLESALRLNESFRRDVLRFLGSGAAGPPERAGGSAQDPGPRPTPASPLRRDGGDTASVASRCVVEHLVRSPEALFGYGWVNAGRRNVIRGNLLLSFPDGARERIALSLDHRRADHAPMCVGDRGSACVGFSIMAGLPAVPPTEATLEFELVDGTVERAALEIPGPDTGRGRDGCEPGPLEHRLAGGVLRFARDRTRPMREMTRRWRRARRLRRQLGTGRDARMRPAVLVIDHSMGGGANLWRDRVLAECIAGGSLVVVLTFRLGDLSFGVEVRDASEPLWSFHVRDIKDAEAFLSAIPIGRIAYGCAVSFPRALETCGLIRRLAELHAARVEVAVHDYFVACPSPFLLDDRGEHCGIPGLERCRNCLSRHADGFVSLAGCRSIDSWRDAWGSLLGASDEVVCFSESSRRLLLRAYPGVSGRIVVRPHVVAPLRRVRRVPIPEGGPIVVGVIGSIARHKGAEVVRDLALAIEARGAQVRIVVIGQLHSDCPSEVVSVTGAYTRDGLPDAVERAGMHVVLFPSICPETFSFVAHEVIAMGMPIITLDVGAPADLAREYGMGLVASRSDGPGLLDEVLSFVDHVRRSDGRASP